MEDIIKKGIEKKFFYPPEKCSCGNKYFFRVRDGRYFHPVTESLILAFLTCIKDEGLDSFHVMAKTFGGAYRITLRNYKEKD